MNSRLLISFCLLTLMIFPALAESEDHANHEIYQWKDKNGVSHFSDTPDKNAKEYEFKQNTKNQLNLPTPSAVNQNQQASNTSYQLSILQPADQATIRNNTGQLSVTGLISPTTVNHLSYQLFVNQQAVGTRQSRIHFNLNNVDRGEHQLQLKAFTSKGEVMAKSPITTIYMHRTIVKATPSPF